MEKGKGSVLLVLKLKQHYQRNIKIDHISSNNLPEIARLYEDAFANHFLGHMGQKFLQLFCSQFVNSSTNYGYVAKCNGKPVGFLLGTIDDDPFYHFYRQNFMALSLIVMRKYLMDAYVRKHIAIRSGNILVAVKALLPFSKRVSDALQDNKFAPARLLAIGVDTSYRGIGIANKLTSQFCTEMKSAGIKKVGLSALVWNRRAIRFYEKDGWILEESNETSLSFSRFL